MISQQSEGRFDRWFEMEADEPDWHLRPTVVEPMSDFQNPKQEWRRLSSELLGTFFLVLVAAGRRHDG
jgi:aquaporin Z